MNDQIYIFDTTMRDGFQASKKNIFRDQKIKVARSLADLGVDVIEAGFPGSYKGAADDVRAISKEVGTSDGPTICALSSAKPRIIDIAARSIEPAKKQRIHTFLATSDIHLEKKLKMTRDEAIDNLVAAVQRARQYVDDVEVSFEDAGRSDNDFMVQASNAVYDAGARTINIPDTVGYCLPFAGVENSFPDKVKHVVDNVRSTGRDPVFSVHTHNDRGLALATTLAAIYSGVRQVEGCMNNIGERAGNTALEEVIFNLMIGDVKNPETGNAFYCSAVPRNIAETSRMVEQKTGLKVAANKAVVGKNAFGHGAGIHQDGMKKDTSTYEIVSAEAVGMKSSMHLSPHIGRAGLLDHYESIGISFEKDEGFNDVADRFYDIAHSVEEVDHADLVRALRGGEEVPVYYNFVDYTPVKTEGGKAKGVFVEMTVNHEHKKVYAEGNGPINAGVNAIKEIAGHNYVLLSHYDAGSEARGSDASAVTNLDVTKNGWSVKGRCEHTDTIESALRAFTDGCNRIKYMEDHFRGYDYMRDSSSKAR